MTMENSEYGWWEGEVRKALLSAETAKAELDKAKHEIADLVEENDELKGEVEAQHEILSETTRDLAYFKQVVKDQANRISYLGGENDGLTDKVANLKEINGQVSWAAYQANERNDFYKNALADRDAVIKKLLIENTELRHETARQKAAMSNQIESLQAELHKVRATNTEWQNRADGQGPHALQAMRQINELKAELGQANGRVKELNFALDLANNSNDHLKQEVVRLTDLNRQWQKRASDVLNTQAFFPAREEVEKLKAKNEKLKTDFKQLFRDSNEASAKLYRVEKERDDLLEQRKWAVDQRDRNGALLEKAEKALKQAECDRDFYYEELALSRGQYRELKMRTKAFGPEVDLTNFGEYAPGLTQNCVDPNGIGPHVPNNVFWRDCQACHDYLRSD